MLDRVGRHGGRVGVVLAAIQALWVTCPAFADDAVGTLIIVARPVPSAKGKVLVQLANSAADYGDDSDAFRRAEIVPQDGKAEVTFPGIPFGEYAIKVFHDENGNRRIDLGWMGPTEAYGFSNNTRGVAGPPTYEAAKFRFMAREQTIEIELKR